MYDNVDLAKQKLHGTMCYYDGRAVYVKDIKMKFSESDAGEPVNKIGAIVADLDGSMTRTKFVMLDDPQFQFMEFNTGYLNYGGYALWYYRIPSRQWRQGLHKSQFQIRDASKLTQEYHNYDNFGTNDATAKMMQNQYPALDESMDMLSNPAVLKVAFHKNFAVYKDKFRKDCIIEYKGIPAAFWDSGAGVFACTDHMKYLRESIQEMNIKVA